MKKTVLLTVASLVLLTGCTSEDTSSADAPDVAAAMPDSSNSESADPNAPELSARGNVILGVGEPAWQGNVDGAEILSFVVTALEVDPVCTNEGATPSENGHLVAVTMEIETSAELSQEMNPYFSLAGWDVIAENGTKQNGGMYTQSSTTCFPPLETLPLNMDPGEKAVGTIVLDVVSPAGTLALRGVDVTNGWEWVYPTAEVAA